MPRPQKNNAVPIDAPERRRLPILLRHAWYGLNQAFRRRIAHLGITPDQFTVMRILLENESQGLMQSELARYMASDPNTIASLIERMEKADLVHRRTHEKDRRANRLKLTATGNIQYRQARDIAVGLQSELLEALPEKRRERFLEDLAKIAVASRNAAEQKPAKAD